MEAWRLQREIWCPLGGRSGKDYAKFAALDEESRRVYAGTAAYDRFLIFHDGLTQWLEPQAQAYLRDVLGFPLDRQMRNEGETNKGNRYYLHVVGDSPELCRGLDSHGFADLKTMLNFCVALTSQYDIDDPERFHMGTPAQVASSLARAWKAAPTSARICEDVKAFDRVLQCIVDAKGCVVPDEALRSGRRYVKLRGAGECKLKPRQSQRKATLHLPPIHPHCQRALSMLKASDVGRMVNAAQIDAAQHPLNDDQPAAI